jgi:hypothetical protein
MFSSIIRKSAYNICCINLKNPLNWNCIGWAKHGIGQSFYIPEVDTMINTGINLVSGNKMNNFTSPKNIFITQIKNETVRYLNIYTKTQNIIYPFKYNSIYNHIYNSVEYNLDNLNVSVNMLNNPEPSCSYGLSIYDKKQLLFMGSISVDYFYENTMWKEYPVIIVDCANYCDCELTIKYYKKNNNLSLYELIPIIRTNRNIRFILTNSNRYISAETIPYIMNIIKKYNIDNIYLWFN